MTYKKKNELTQNSMELFTKIFMKYDILEKKPIVIGKGVKLHSTHIHTIEAIGKNYATSVTTLSNYFMITKGAVSQVISSLEKKGYIKKTKAKDNGKNIILQLTKKGVYAFDFHEQYNESVMKDLIELQNKYSEIEMEIFLRMLTDFDSFLGNFIADELKSSI